MWNEAKIRELLNTNDRAVERALLVLLERQTATEQQSETTFNRNDQGFCPADAKMMTSMAKWVKRGGHLSPKQLAWLRNGKSERYPSRIGKYHRQLLEATAEKEAKKAAEGKPAAPQAATLPTLQQYWDQLNAHDWHYSFSDDPAVYRRGHAAHTQLALTANRGGEKYEELRRAFASQDTPKPERPQ